MDWPFWQYVHPNSGLTPPYSPTPSPDASHPFYPPWYQPQGGTGMSPYASGGMMPPGGAPPPPMPPGGGPGLPAMPPQGGPPGSVSNGQINPRNFMGDMGRGLQFLGRALPIGQLGHLFGSSQGDPDVQKQIQDQFAKSGRPDPFAPPAAQAMPSPMPASPPAAQAMPSPMPASPPQPMSSPMGMDPLQSLREMPLQPQPMQQQASAPPAPMPPPQAAAQPPMPPMPPVRPQMPPQGVMPTPQAAPSPEPPMSYYNGPGSMNFGAGDQAPGLASPVPASQNLPDGNIGMMLRALMNRG